MKCNLSSILILAFSMHTSFAQNTPVPEMPIPPEFQQPILQQVQQPGLQPQQPSPPSDQPFPPQQQVTQPLPVQSPANEVYNLSPAQPEASRTVAATPQAQMPSDFELIVIKPYFKNKPRLGHLTATLFSETNEVLGSVEGDFGDCQNCIRGASVKGKLGIRLYGKEASQLTVSRKQSNSIQITACDANNNRNFVNNVFHCEFIHNKMKMKLTLKLSD